METTVHEVVSQTNADVSMGTVITNISICFLLFVVTIIGVVSICFILLKEMNRDEYNKIENAQKESRERWRRSRIAAIEPLARKGDLIAFQEWKQLTGRHDIVDVRNIPDITITGFSVEI